MNMKSGAYTVLIALALGGCGQTFSTSPVNTVQIYDPADTVQEYTQRADAITLSAGNAQQVNSRIHAIDPWPRNVADTRIPGNGDRMSEALWRYRCQKEAPPALPTRTTNESFSGVAATAGAAGSGRPGGECAGVQLQVQTDRSR